MRRTSILIAGMLILGLTALNGCRPEPGVPQTDKPDGKPAASQQQAADQPEEWIAYVSSKREARNMIVLKEIHSGEEIIVADTPQQQYTDPRFSLDGTKLIFQEYRHVDGTGKGIYWLYDIASGESTELGDMPPMEEYQVSLSDKTMRMSPDEKWLLSSQTQPSTTYMAIHVLNKETKVFKPILKGRGAECVPGTYSWNKDSRRYMYIRKAPDRLWQVYIGDIIDGTHTQVTTDKENKAMPRWRPTP